MKRPLTLIGALLGFGANATIIVLNAMLLLFLFSLAGQGNGSAILLLALLEIDTFLINIIFDIIIITAWRNDASRYKKKRVIIILAIIFSIIGAVIAFMMNATQYYILASVLILTAVMFVIDLGLEKRRIAKVNERANLLAQVEPQSSIKE